eukprot:10842367-Karenia_brevis.AAC.1
MEDWMTWMWDIQVGAVQHPSVQCWVCGQMGHMGRNCPSKGKGKGGPPAGKGASIHRNPLGGKGIGAPAPG